MDEGISLGLVMALVEEATGADPAVIEQAVQDWLDDHPEATTTVADGSITEQKLAAAVAAKINQVSQLSDEIDDIIIVDNLFTSSDYEHGTFSSVGRPEDSQYRIRLKKNYYAEYDFSITNKQGYTINVFKFNADGTYNSQTGFPANDVPLTINITKGEFINLVISKYPIALTDTSAYSGAVFSNVNKIKILENEVDELGNDYKINALKDCAFFFENADMTYLTHKYYVGAGRQYTTINDALTAWANDEYPHAVVFIANGEYQEKVFVDSGKTIALIGESKDGTIIRTITGDYSDAPVFIRHGTILLENLTVIADHTGNPSFDYTGATNFAYAFHIDGGSVGDKVIVRNCKAVSYQSAAFGMGLIPGSTIRLEDVEAYCYTASGKGSTDYGCVLCHLADKTLYPSSDTQSLDLVNVGAYAKNYKSPISLVQGTSEQTMQINAINVTTASGVTDEQTEMVTLPTLYNLSNLSFGNTSPVLNK